tara:strand:+ start:1287 stop:1877 length:591 start_codon:yes stop_codon:yes gene_type:complete
VSVLSEQASGGRRIGYARVSTIDQHEALQLDALKAAGCVRIFVEAASAVGSDRPEFLAALECLQSGDTFVIWKLDRAFRSTIDAIATWDRLRQRGVQMLITTLGIVSDTPEGRYFYRGLASAAEFERDMISARTKEGLAAARRRGKRLGRPPLLDFDTAHEAHRQHCQKDVPNAVLAERLEVSPSTLRRAYERFGL